MPEHHNPLCAPGHPCAIDSIRRRRSVLEAPETVCAYASRFTSSGSAKCVGTSWESDDFALRSVSVSSFSYSLPWSTMWVIRSLVSTLVNESTGIVQLSGCGGDFLQPCRCLGRLQGIAAAAASLTHSCDSTIAGASCCRASSRPFDSSAETVRRSRRHRAWSRARILMRHQIIGHACVRW
jgi:hypothetical protein